jgi:hypothetical protein
MTYYPERDVIAVNLMRIVNIGKHDARILADQVLSVARQSGYKSPLEFSSFEQKTERHKELLKQALLCFEIEDLSKWSSDVENAVISAIKESLARL